MPNNSQQKTSRGRSNLYLLQALGIDLEKGKMLIRGCGIKSLTTLDQITCEVMFGTLIIQVILVNKTLMGNFRLTLLQSVCWVLMR